MTPMQRWLRGDALLLVPALPRIYGSLDQAFGHYRRYTKTSLAGKLHVAGFRIIRLAYVNLLGIAGWFLTGRVLRRMTLQPRYVRWYDQWVIPWLSRLEERWEPPCGQSLIVIAQKFEPTGGLVSGSEGDLARAATPSSTAWVRAEALWLPNSLASNLRIHRVE